MPPILNLKGKKFGMLLVEKTIGINRIGKSISKCICDCGKKCITRSSDLTSGNTKSCGCHRFKANYRHGDTAAKNITSEYRAWTSIKQRTLNPKSQHWKHYGGRGIKMHKSWINNFSAFLTHVGRKPHPLLTIDRINNEGNYEPGNLRWATRKQQIHNRRKHNK